VLKQQAPPRNKAMTQESLMAQIEELLLTESLSEEEKIEVLTDVLAILERKE
jgi:hypothetical protein